MIDYYLCQEKAPDQTLQLQELLEEVVVATVDEEDVLLYLQTLVTLMDLLQNRWILVGFLNQTFDVVEADSRHAKKLAISKRRRITMKYEAPSKWYSVNRTQ